MLFYHAGYGVKKQKAESRQCIVEHVLLVRNWNKFDPFYERDNRSLFRNYAKSFHTNSRTSLRRLVDSFELNGFHNICFFPKHFFPETQLQFNFTIGLTDKMVINICFEQKGYLAELHMKSTNKFCLTMIFQNISGEYMGRNNLVERNISKLQNLSNWAVYSGSK